MTKQRIPSFLFLLALGAAMATDSNDLTHTGRRVVPLLSADDEERAHRPFPPKGSKVLASDPSESVAHTLNRYLVQALPADKLRACEEHTLEELNDVLAALVSSVHPALQEIYDNKCATDSGCDKRSMRKGNLEDYQADWASEAELLEAQPNDGARAVITSVLRQGKCFESVQLYYHHLSYETRVGFPHTLPLLPEAQEDVKEIVRYVRQQKGIAKARDTDRCAKAGADAATITASATTSTGRHHHNHPQDRHLDMVFFQDEIHDNVFSQETLTAKEQFLRDQLAAINGANGTLADLLAKYNTQSPCSMSHRTLSNPWTSASAEEAGVPIQVAALIETQLKNDSFSTMGVPEKDYPDTVIPGAGYIDCEQATQCLEGGDRQYMMQAVVRSYVVKGSANIQASGSSTPFGVDASFHTRTFEAIPGSPSEWGPDEAGGDGTLGLLGPAFVANPGETVHIFVKNNLADTSALGPFVPTALDYWCVPQIPTASWSGFRWPN